jgi:putative protein kinase ArgK-like GTPase of G3E family
MTREVQELRDQCAILAGNVNALARAMSLLVERLQTVEAQSDSVAFIQRHMRMLEAPRVPGVTTHPPQPSHTWTGTPGVSVVPWVPPLPPLPSIT